MKTRTTHDQIRTKNLRRARKPHAVEERVRADEISPLIELTHHADPGVRKQAVHELCPCSVRANNEQVWDRLLTMVMDEDPKVRGQVLHTLADGSPREREQDVVHALERMQHDPDPRLRRRVRHLLAHYRRGGRINIL